jgi:hypothetical protein
VFVSSAADCAGADCSQPAYWLIPLLLLANWALVFVVYVLLGSDQSAGSKLLLYFTQVCCFSSFV